MLQVVQLGRLHQHPLSSPSSPEPALADVNLLPTLWRELGPLGPNAGKLEQRVEWTERSDWLE